MPHLMDQLHQLSIAASPSRPSLRYATSTASISNIASNPYSPSLTPAQLAEIDTSLSSAVAALVHHLTQPLAAKYPHSTIILLRSALIEALTRRYESSWRTTEPSFGSGFRSLICDRVRGLPGVLKQAAREAGVNAEVWRQSLKGKPREDAPYGDNERDEWEAWCDPGTVSWRYGGHTWSMPEFERPVLDSIITVWYAGPTFESETSDHPAPAPSITPARPSAAIAIRAPSVALVPATPAHASGTATVPEPLSFRPSSPNLMPAANIGVRPVHYRSSSSVTYTHGTSPISEDDESMFGRPHARASTYPMRSGHGSSSSIDSSISDSNSGATQLLTPASRPGSADPFTAAANASIDDKTPTPGTLRGRDPSPMSRQQVTPTAPGKVATPSVTPYDGGNVTVLGGGVKLGGGAGGPPGSRPVSVVSQHRMPMMDRSRSPSVSIASRALNSALTPGEMGNGGGRKPRTRRRIMPTYLGYVGQPGVGGPASPAFQPLMLPKGGSGQPGQAQPQQMGQQAGWQPSLGVGMGIRTPLTRIA